MACCNLVCVRGLKVQMYAKIAETFSFAPSFAPLQYEILAFARQ